MNDMTPPPAGHNNPPDPIEEISATYETEREEAEAWADGQAVTNEVQMKSVDELREDVRQWRLDLERGQEEAVKPLRDATTAERNRWKPIIEDAKRIEGCLVDIVAPFKAKLAEEAKEAERKAWEETNRLRLEAEAQEAQARAGDIEAQRAANAAKQAVIDAEKAAKKAVADAPKGMRTVTKYEITGHKALLHFIASKHKDDLTAFIEEWARKNHKSIPADGLRVWQDKEAF